LVATFDTGTIPDVRAVREAAEANFIRYRRRGREGCSDALSATPITGLPDLAAAVTRPAQQAIGTAVVASRMRPLRLFA
jgi:hypothetical protein